MFLRFLGRLFLYFVIVPELVDAGRLVRKNVQPIILDMIKDMTETVKNDLTEDPSTTPTSV